MACVVDIVSPRPGGSRWGVAAESEDGLCGGSMLQENSPSLSEGTASPGIKALWKEAVPCVTFRAASQGTDGAGYGR